MHRMVHHQPPPSPDVYRCTDSDKTFPHHGNVKRHQDTRVEYPHAMFGERRYIFDPTSALHEQLS